MTDLHWSGLQCQHVWDQGGKNRLIVNLLITFVVLCIEFVDMCILHIFGQRVITALFSSFKNHLTSLCSLLHLKQVLASSDTVGFHCAESFCCLFPQTLRPI